MAQEAASRQLQSLVNKDYMVLEAAIDSYSLWSTTLHDIRGSYRQLQSLVNKHYMVLEAAIDSYNLWSANITWY